MSQVLSYKINEHFTGPDTHVQKIMKISKLLIIAILFTGSLFAFSPAKAQTTSTVAIESTGGWFDWLTDLLGGGSSSSSSKSRI